LDGTPFYSNTFFLNIGEPAYTMIGWFVDDTDYNRLYKSSERTITE
jgi:hypothetical protein